MQFMVTSKKEGFRRCGVAWPKGPSVFDEARFSPEEWKAIKAEPMLIVTAIGTKSEPEAPETADETPEAGLEAAASEKPGKARKPKE